MDILNTIINMLKGGSEPDEKTIPATTNPPYPSSGDVDFARSNDYSYGQPWASEFQGRNARLLDNYRGQPLQKPLPNTTLSGDAYHNYLNNNNMADVGDIYAKAALAAQRSGLATYGFDPNHTIIDTLHDPKVQPLLGAYAPKIDQVYVNARTPEIMVHESMHRGISNLEKSPYWKDSFKQFGTENPDMNEMLVRHLMQSKIGNEEELHDPGANLPRDMNTGKQERERAKWLFNQSSGASGLRKIADEMEQAGAQAYAARRPGGPR